MNRIKDGESMGEIVVFDSIKQLDENSSRQTTAPNKKTKAHTHIHTKRNKHTKKTIEYSIKFHRISSQLRIAWNAALSQELSLAKSTIAWNSIILNVVSKC